MLPRRPNSFISSFILLFPFHPVEQSNTSFSLLNRDEPQGLSRPKKKKISSRPRWVGLVDRSSTLLRVMRMEISVSWNRSRPWALVHGPDGWFEDECAADEPDCTKFNPPRPPVEMPRHLKSLVFTVCRAAVAVMYVILVWFPQLCGWALSFCIQISRPVTSDESFLAVPH